MARKILLNYRRADTKGFAIAIYNSLVSSFGEDQIFMDIDTIEPGTDFVKVLEKAVQQCDVLIVLIGPQWLEIKDASGKRRLDNESDFVRLEIKAALERGISVLPVLVQDAKMSSAKELPDDIRSLARRQAFVISDRFSADVEQLAEVLNRILERAKQERLEKEKAEKKKSAKPRKKITKPDIILQKQPVKVLKSATVKAEVKPKAAEKARKRAPAKPMPKKTRWTSYALTAAAILVISYVIVKNTDIFTSAGSSSISTEEQPIPEVTEIPAEIEIPAVKYPISGGLSSVVDEIEAINTSNVNQIIEMVRWDDGVIHELAYSPVEDVIVLATSNDIHIMQVDHIDGNYDLNEIRTIHFDVALSFESNRTNLSISPDGSTLATGHEDGRVRLWQVSDGELLHTLGSPNGLAGAIVFSPDGSTLAFHANGRTVQLWRVSDGKPVGNLGDQNLPFTECTAFSPDGTMLASGHQDGVVRLWLVSDGELLDIFGESSDAESGWVSAVAFSPDGSVLASGHDDGNVKLWQIPVGNLLEILPTGFDWERVGWINSLIFSPDGSMLAAGYEHITTRIWRTSDWKVLKDLEDSHDGSTLSVSFSPDGNLFATSSMGGALRLHRVSDWEEVASSSWDSAGIHSIALSPDKSVIASASKDGIVRLWQISDEELLHTMGKPGFSQGAIAFSPDGNTLAFERNGLVYLHQVSDGKQVEVFRVNWNTRSIAFSPDGSMLATGHDGTRVRLWQVSDGRPLDVFGTRSHEDSDLGNTVAFSPDGSILAAGDGEGTVRLWQVLDGELLHTLKGHNGYVTSVAFTPDGSMLATSGQEGIVWLWRVSDGVLIHEVEPDPEYQHWVNSLTFTPDGEVLFGSWKYIWLWGVSEGNFIKRLGRSESSISCMALSSDGTLLVTGSSDSTIQIWGVTD